MQSASDFFTAGSSPYAVTPPKRITPASRGNGNNGYWQSGGFLSRLSAGTTIVPGARPSGSAANSMQLLSASTGNVIATLTSSTLWSGHTSAYFAPETLCYDYAAGFWYCLILDIGSGSAILAKINDTTGAASLVGSAFTLTDSANWYGGTAWISGGNMLYLATNSTMPATSPGGAYLHTISISTGVPSSQNGSFSLSDGTNLSAAGPVMLDGVYITSDQSAIVSFTRGSLQGAALSGLSLRFAKGGQVVMSRPGVIVPDEFAGLYGRGIYNGECLSFIGSTYLWPTFDRADFDRYVKALIKANAGV